MNATYRVRCGLLNRGARITARRTWIGRVMFEGMKLAVLMLFVGSLRLCAQTSLPSGYQLKAAFLFNFVKFIDWPASSFANSQSPFTICVLGQDPFGSILEDTLQGKMIGDRSLTLRRLRDRAEVRLCQMVFVSSSERAHMAEIIAVVQGTGVLLVGETNGFAASGGTIEFTLEDNHVRFTINTDAADRSGLKFSSKLLAVAKIVHNGGI